MEKSRKVLIAEIFISDAIKKVWDLWTHPRHIKNWNNTSNEWHTPHAENDLKINGKLFLRMERKDGSEGFDYICTYTKIVKYEKISYTTADNRKTTVLFSRVENGVKLTEIFEPEHETPIETQQAFSQSILRSFKRYVEKLD